MLQGEGSLTLFSHIVAPLSCNTISSGTTVWQGHGLGAGHHIARIAHQGILKSEHKLAFYFQLHHSQSPQSPQSPPHRFQNKTVISIAVQNF
jgi:hypothetical protein